MNRHLYLSLTIGLIVSMSYIGMLLSLLNQGTVP